MDLQQFLCFPPEVRVSRIRELCSLILTQGGTTALQWQVLLGLLAASEKAVPLGRLHSREMHFELRTLWDFDPNSRDLFHPTFYGLSGRAAMVDVAIQCSPRLQDCAPSSNLASPDGCFGERLGSTPGRERSQSVGPVVRGGDSAPHQLVRVESGVFLHFEVGSTFYEVIRF